MLDRTLEVVNGGRFKDLQRKPISKGEISDVGPTMLEASIGGWERG